MIILTAGHTGPNTGAQCAETHFDEGAENIWLRNRIAEILTNKYNLVVLMDNDTASLKLLVKTLTDDLSLTENMSHTEPKVFEPKVKKLTDNTEEIKTCLLGRDFAQQKQDHYVKEKSSYVFLSKNPTSTASSNLCKSDERLLTKSKQRIEKELKNQSDLCNLWETPHSEGVTSVRSVSSVSEKESSVRNKNSEGVTSVRSVSSVREKNNSVREKESSVREKENSVRNKNSEGVKSVQICRAKIANKRGQRSFLRLPSRSNFNGVKSCVARERIEEKEELKSELSVQSVGDKIAGEATASSVLSVSSVRDKKISVREKESSVRNKNSEGVTSVSSVSSVSEKESSVREKESSVREKESSVRSDDFVIDLHFNAHSNPNARGTEAIVADDATTLELQFASRLVHTTSDALAIPLRSIKSESQTPHRRLGMLHLTPQSIILEVCFCTSPEDVEAYRNNREKLAAELAWAIAELLPSVVSTDNRQQSTDESDR